MKALLRWIPLVAVLVALPLDAGANVRKEGSWPAQEKNVSFSFDGKPSEGLSELASEAGWSLILSKDLAQGEHDVKIAVEDQPADRVLEALFAESDVVARRSGSLVTITPAHGGGAVAPVPTERGADRNVLGDSVTIGQDEVVHTLTVTGGAAKIRGTITGDLVVAGGSAEIEEGGHVVGNVTVFGGALKVARGGRVDGDVGVVGGALKREDGAVIGGKVVDGAHGGRVQVSRSDAGDIETSVESKRESRGSGLARAAHSFGQSLTNMALLFVLGCVLLALATRRMDVLRVEVAARPMRSFAMGIASALAATVGIVALCVTLVGIPVALLLVLLGVFSVYASLCGVLTTFGAAVAGHRTKNVYVHLLIGCVALLVVTSIPYLGGIVMFVVTMIALGALTSTRLAGLVAKRAPRSEHA